MRSIEEITQLLGEPAGTWSGVSECLEAIKEHPLAYRDKGLLTPEKLQELFPAETLRAHKILILSPGDEYQFVEPGRCLVMGGSVIQNHPNSEVWYFGNTQADVWAGQAHGYDSAKIGFSLRTRGDIHDQVMAYCYGDYVKMEAYDHSCVTFEKAGELDLYDDAKGHAYNWFANITTHDRSRVDASEVHSIHALDQSLVVATDARVVLNDQAAAVAYGKTKVEARDQNRVWMIDADCRPIYAKPASIFCKAYEKADFRQAIHATVHSPRTVPEVLSRLNELTIAHGPAIREDWDFGEDVVWLTRINIDDNGNFTNIPKDWSKQDNLYPTRDKNDNVDIQVYVEDRHSESSAMLNHAMEQRGYYLKDDPHTFSYAEFKHWGNAMLFNETVRYEEAVLHKLRPAVQLQEASSERKQVRQPSR